MTNLNYFKIANICISIWTILFVFLVSSSLAQSKNKTTAYQIAEKTQEVYKLKGVESISEMINISSRGKKKIRKITQISKLYDDQTEKSLIRFISPADVKGTSFLIFDYKNSEDDIWIFLPALRKTRRIVSSQKNEKFMGSEFTYADITSEKLNDFNYKVLKEEALNSTECWVLESRAKNDKIAKENGFKSKVSYVGKSDFVIRKSIYFNEQNEKIKELLVSQIKEIDPERHKYRPMYMEMTNFINQRKSIVKIESINFVPNVDDKFFKISYMWVLR